MADRNYTDELPSDPELTPAIRGGHPTSVMARRLVFEVSGTLFAVDVGQVREAIDLPPVTPLPGAPDWVLGLANVRGLLFAVLDLGKFLQMEPASEGPEPTCLVFQHAGRRLGGLVSGLVSVSELEDAKPDVETGMLQALRARPFVVSVSTYDGRPLWHLDMERVFSDVYP